MTARLEPQLVQRLAAADAGAGRAHSCAEKVFGGVTLEYELVVIKVSCRVYRGADAGEQLMVAEQTDAHFGLLEAILQTAEEVDAIRRVEATVAGGQLEQHVLFHLVDARRVAFGDEAFVVLLGQKEDVTVLDTLRRLHIARHFEQDLAHARYFAGP